MTHERKGSLRILLFAVVIIAVLLPVSLASSSFGYSRISLERTWIVTGAKGVPVEFHGALSVNNSNQRIVSVTTEPMMEQEMKDGVLWVTYKGAPPTDPFVIRGTVIADIDYDPKILSDSKAPTSPLDSSNLTMFDENITQQARLLTRDDSSLETIRSLTKWVHDGVTYDVNYWGKSESAKTVFSERRGVCVEYTHLLIAMARSIGFDTRYVSGYIYENGWQQHAWAEILIPGYGYLPADATFGQIGIMDNTHFGVHYGPDQSYTYDTLTSTSDSVNLTASDTPTVILQESDPKGVSISMGMDNQTYVSDVTMTNSRSVYVFGSYSFLVPQSYGADSYDIILLRPNQVMHRFHGINRSLFEAGFSYKIPVYISFNDAKLETDVNVDGSSVSFSNTSPGNGQPKADASPCLPGLMILTLLFLVKPLSAN